MNRNEKSAGGNRLEDMPLNVPRGKKKKKARGNILAKEAQAKGDVSFSNYGKDTKSHDNTC